MGERKEPLEVVSWGVLALISTLIVTTYGVCEFPPLWRGDWFLDSIQAVIQVNRTSLSTRGQCLSSKGDKYLMEDRREDCVRCLSIHAKHKNVLQFKETLCEKFETLESVCASLTGDAPLISMFRADDKAKTTDCPLKNLPLAFSYNKGNGECESPMSMLDACSDDSKLIFRYQACPDIKGSESSVEVLTCLGFWKEGFLRYFVGKVHFSKTNQTEFRCFIYDKGLAADKTTFYNLAQSGDQSCSGLLTPVDGANVMILTPLPATKTKCRYPLWITEHSHWHTLDGGTSYIFFRKNGTLQIIEDIHRYHRNIKEVDSDLRVVCHSQVFLNSTVLIAIAHLTRGCETSYSCLGFFRRDTNVIEILQSRVVLPSPEEVCSEENFNPYISEYVTLVPLLSSKRACPYTGKYSVNTQGGALSFKLTTLESYFTKPALEHFNYTIPPEPKTTIFWWLNTSYFTSIPTSTNNPFFGNASFNATTSFPISSTNSPPPTATTSRVVNCSPGQYKRIEIGCSLSGETLEFIHTCNRQFNSMYFCHGHWIDKNYSFLIVSPVSRKSLEPKYYCFMWKPFGGGLRKSKNVTTELKNFELRVSAAASNCHRTITPGASGLLTFSLSVTEFCEKTLGPPPPNQNDRLVPTLLFLLIIPPLAYAAR